MLKYRVWCPTYNEWEQDEIRIINGVVYQVKPSGLICSPSHPIEYKMLDYNIYHGDIIEYQGQRYIVVQDSQSNGIQWRFSWVKNKKIIYRSINDFGSIDLNKAKVIGNIHENPALLWYIKNK